MAIFKGFTKMTFLYEKLTRSELNILKRWVNTKLENRRDAYLNLCSYVDHYYNCKVAEARPSQGRPTADGGYEQYILGKWYRVSPIDESPKVKCTCGLDDILKNFNIK